MEAVKKSKLNLDLAMQYVLETPLEQPPQLTVTSNSEPVTRASGPQPALESKSSARDQLEPTKTLETEVSERKKKPSTSALKRKVSQVKEMIPDASDEVILQQLAQVNGDVDKCILLLLDDPDAGARLQHVNGIEPMPSDSSDEEPSDDEIDSTGSFGEYLIKSLVTSLTPVQIRMTWQTGTTT
mgnify:CR=1 FL=1